MFNITSKVINSEFVIFSYETNLVEKNFTCTSNETTLIIKIQNETDYLDDFGEILCNKLLPSHQYELEIDFDDIDCTSNGFEPVKTSKIGSQKLFLLNFLNQFF
jgi:hypothetical protein